MVIAGRLIPEQTRENDNGRWVRGDIMPYGLCARLLEEIGPKGQRRLPFTIVTPYPIPKKPVIAVGSLSEYIHPDGSPWYTLDISEYYEKDDPALETFGTWNELTEKIAKKNNKVIDALGDRNTRVKEALQKIFGTGNSFPERMMERFGTSAYDMLKKNPWKMIHVIPYFTIKQADQAAVVLGIPLTDENRFREYFRSRMDLFFENRKDTYIGDNDFYALYLMDFSNEMSKEEFMEKTMDGDDPLVFKTKLGIHPAQFYYDEKASVKLIRRVGMVTIPETGEIREAEEITKRFLTFELTPEQEHGFKYAFRSPIHFITGGPGTGKTTLLSAILMKLQILTHANLSDPNSPVLLAAPTGKAAYRMWEQTGVPAHTINSAFRIIPDYGCVDMEQTAESLSHVQYLIMDESSMLDTHLFGEVARILMKMDHIPFLLIVGDVDQLASVGHGQVFKDLLEYAQSVYPECVTRLTILKRQKNGSNIPELAAIINSGKFPGKDWFMEKNDVKFLQTSTNQLSNILEQAVLAPKRGDLDNVQIITPFRNGTMCDTVPAINGLAQPYYNPDPEGKSITINNPDRTFYIGSRVINKKNRSETVINGSIGTITAMHTSSNDLFEWSVIVKFDSGEEVVYPYGDLRELDLSYAITVHAAQGSEYENVVMCITRGGANGEFLNRNLLYTGVTRAAKKLILLGEPRAYAIAAATPAPVRKTALSEWLKDLHLKGTK